MDKELKRDRSFITTFLLFVGLFLAMASNFTAPSYNVLSKIRIGKLLLGSVFKFPYQAGFFILIFTFGFIEARTFFNDDFVFNAKNILKYYVNKILTVLLPAVIFVFADILIRSPGELLKSGNIFIKILLGNFNLPIDKAPSTHHLWLISSLMWMYLFTPLFLFLLDKFKNFFSRHNYDNVFYLKIYACIFIVAALFGFYFRIISDYKGRDLYTFIYTSPIGNADLYICGFLSFYFLSASKINDRFFKILSRTVVMLLFLSLLFLTSFIFLKSEITTPGLIKTYIIKLPIAYCFILSFLLVIFLICDNNDKDKNSSLSRFLSASSRFFEKTALYIFIPHTLFSLLADKLNGNGGVFSYLLKVFLTFTMSLVFVFVFYIGVSFISKRIKTGKKA